MTQQNIQLFVAQNGKMFNSFQLQQIVNQLQSTDDEQIIAINSANYKNPTTLLIISLLFGGLGVDRFILGDIGLGILKLLTGGCFGILTIIDWFTIQKKAKQKNFLIFYETLNVTKTLKNEHREESLDNQANDKSIEQIKKYKQLLDNDLITQEEFDSKKKELL